VRKSLWTAVLLCAALLVPAVPAQAADPNPRKTVYLTFDDGPDSLYTPRLLRILKRYHVPATFFLVGQSLAADPGRATDLWLRGHAVGNHTWSHLDLTQLSALQVRQQLRSTQTLMGRAGGACMRPPYGAHNVSVDAVSASLGLSTVMWTVDPKDWQYQDAGHITTHVLGRVRDKSIVLLHDGGGPRAQTLAAVEAIIPQLLWRGYEFRTVRPCRQPLGGTVLGAAKEEKVRKAQEPVVPESVSQTPEPAVAG
jgi:peptidoglycan/xylan/chitin deacetylase (PgdA/CDA1 family)